jgi:predicted RNA-binding Zn ribbon-like protein
LTATGRLISPEVAMKSGFTGKTLPRLGGRLCLDFVNTIDPRLKAPNEEFLASYGTLLAWAEFVGILSRAARRQLVIAGEHNPRVAKQIHRRALDLREGLFTLFTGAPEAQAGLQALNSEIRLTSAELHLEREGAAYALAWDAGAKVLGPIVRSAIELLTSSDVGRVRVCAGDGCGWLFLDSSRTHRRRWCSMAICGNRAKAKRSRLRSRGRAQMSSPTPALTRRRR